MSRVLAKCSGPLRKTPNRFACRALRTVVALQSGRRTGKLGRRYKALDKGESRYHGFQLPPRRSSIGADHGIVFLKAFMLYVGNVILFPRDEG